MNILNDQHRLEPHQTHTHHPNTAAKQRDPCLTLIEQLQQLRQAMLSGEKDLQSDLARVQPSYRDSAKNLVHYLNLRSVDLRPLQEQLSQLGLSSLGRSEPHVLANLDKVLGVLHRLTHPTSGHKTPDAPVASLNTEALLQAHTVDLLGPAPEGRTTRIMVTLAKETASNYATVKHLVNAGMDIARINCAHDSPQDWLNMVANVRRAAEVAQRTVKILVDLGGPKIRTGEIAHHTPVLKVKPVKDHLGRVVRPARLLLRPIRSNNSVPGVDASVGVWDQWLERLKSGMSVDFVDARGAKRHLQVIRRDDQGAIAECPQTAYLTPETVLTLGGSTGKKKHTTLVCQIESQPGSLHLNQGDVLHLTKPTTDSTVNLPAPQVDTSQGDGLQISCTLPQVIDQARVGERIWFDDGRIGGVIREKHQDYLSIHITQARESGEKLSGDKGINLPDSQLDLPPITTKDLNDLGVMAAYADMVGLSFVHQPTDVLLLRDKLHTLGRDDMGIVLKIETLRGFENLPALMLAAMGARAAGVMIARGDLAVECGYERLAEVQEEILWCTEAAHMPVIWATQVLESMVKTGLPSRAEISDAGLGVRAECVMLNKGAYITQAIQTLDDILKRMGGHQAKKRPLMRALHAWGSTQAMAAHTPSEPSTGLA
jgi:pyruvate kinase